MQLASQSDDAVSSDSHASQLAELSPADANRVPVNINRIL
jgi:hypothetical protein